MGQAGVFPHAHFEDVHDAFRQSARASDSVLAILTAETILSWVMARRILIAIAVILGVVVALGYGFTAKSNYVAYTDIMVPPSNLQVLPNDIYTASQQQSDTQLLDIQTKLQLITSGNVLKRVVQDLKLDTVAEFNGKDDDLLSRILNVFGGHPSDPDTVLSAARILAKRIKIERQAGTYLATIAVSARNPEMAVDVAQSLNRAFMSELSQTDIDLATEATFTLESRLAELKRAAAEAAAAAAAFRQSNGLQSSAGELMSSQTLTQINMKRVDAQANFLQKQSRYNQLIAKSTDILNPSNGLQSPGLTLLRQQYSQLNQSYENMALIYGPLHPQLILQKQQLGMAKAAIAEEIDRLRQAARIDMDQARSVLDDLTRQVTTARDSVSIDSNAQVKLDELERDARTKAALYDSFLKRAGETSERQQINLTNVRVVSRPQLPERRSWPPPALLLGGVGGAAGLLLGLFLAAASGFLTALRENRKMIGV